MNTIWHTLSGLPYDQFWANTVLLLHGDGTNGSTTFTDSTGKNTITPGGNAQISTAQSKFGGSSMYFDGSGDYLTIPSSSNFAFGTGDFTIEGWINPSLTPSTNWTPILAIGEGSASIQGHEIRIGQNVNGEGLGYVIPNNTNNGAVIISSGTLALNQWSHLALVRYGSTVTLYKNGVSVGSTTGVSFNFGNYGPMQAGYGFYTSDGYFNGYIDDLRITKGVARYTSNFTVPTQAFTNF